MKYTDTDGRICFSYFDNIKGKFGIKTFSPVQSKILIIDYSILDFYPLGLGDVGKRIAEFIGSGFSNDLKVIESSTTKGYKLNDVMNNVLSKYGDADNALYISSKIADALDKFSKGAKMLGKVSSFTGNISNYVINPSLLGLSFSDSDTSIIDNFIVGVFGNSMYSNTREGVENKYKLVQNEVVKSLKTGNLQLRFNKDKNVIEYQLKNGGNFNDLINKLNEMD